MSSLFGTRTPSPAAVLALPVAGAAVLGGMVAAQAPVLALAGLVGGMYLVASVLSITAGLAIFAFLSFAVFSVLPTAATIGSLLLVGSWLISTAGRELDRRDLLGDRPLFSLLLVTFLAWCALSLIWAENVAGGQDMLLRLAPCLLLLPVAWAALKDRRAVIVVVAAMVSGAVFALLADPIAPARADVSMIGIEASRRIGGIVGDPNELAAILLPALALAVGLCAVCTRGPWRALAAAAAACCALGLLMTVSRGGLVAAAVMLVVVVATGGRSRRKLLVVALGLIVAAVAWFAVFAPAGARDHLTADDRGAGRAGLWEISLRMLQDRPVTGVGLGSFREAGPDYVVRPGAIRSDLVITTPELAHNTFLQFATELGLTGLLLFLAIAAACIASAVRVLRWAREEGDRFFEVLARAALAAQVGVLTATFFFSYTVGKPLWLVLALGPGLLAATRAHRDPAVPARPA